MERDLSYVLSNIRKQRELRNYTQEYMGACLGIGQNGYSKLEIGLTKITVERLIDIAYTLNVNVELLLMLPKIKKTRVNYAKWRLQ